MLQLMSKASYVILALAEGRAWHQRDPPSDSTLNTDSFLFSCHLGSADSWQSQSLQKWWSLAMLGQYSPSFDLSSFSVNFTSFFPADFVFLTKG